MRAIQLDRPGGPDALTVRELPAPARADGEVLIRTIASSINPVDSKTRAMAGPERLPMTLGWDLAGVVLASDHPGFSTGDRVIAMSAQFATGRGTWADIVSLPADLLAVAPASVSLSEAATLPLAGLTALQVMDRLRLTAGQTLLVTGAAGAVGGLAVQLAAHDGITVHGLVSRPEHVDAARRLGADTATDQTGELGCYDAVFDTAGVHVPQAVKDGGKYLTVGADTVPDGLASRTLDAGPNYVEQDGAGLSRLAALVDAGALRLRIGAQFPIHQSHQAHRRAEQGGLLGKVVLTF
ncbi:NADP-dependent oxidoreductase [Actinokineospora bangkokensis]|uniref:Alcohol dehydrogenase n=1 Tax=Actinokineospora bangkokensis TaxID=1193682 RepID=A0A1Q9LQZ4_9PSEU|nr:NADP-dependent oxidoreductase [Actinokineospora bangkokensis]OLR94423.1 alcohol dehydrogenase [Actinokineospora bangkokensis]